MSVLRDLLRRMTVKKEGGVKDVPVRDGWYKRIVPQDEFISLCWYWHDWDQAWKRLGELWPDVDIQESRVANGGERVGVGSILYVRKKNDEQTPG